MNGTSNELLNISHEDLTAMLENTVKGILKNENKAPEKEKLTPRSSTPRRYWFSESDDPDDSIKGGRRQEDTNTREVRGTARTTKREKTHKKTVKNRREDSSGDRYSDTDDGGSFRDFAKLMGDNLVALRKMHERPPRWSGPRMKTYKGDPKESFDDFADEVIGGCEKMGLKDDEREKIRYLRGFLEGEAAEFLASIPNKNQQTLKEILKKIRDRFKDSRTQSDFVYILTTKKHDPKCETVGEYSHSLHNLIVKA